jgi:hypothetical protein
LLTSIGINVLAFAVQHHGPHFSKHDDSKGMIEQFGPTMAPFIDVDIINNSQMKKVVELVSRSAFGSYKPTIPPHDDVRMRESPHGNPMGLSGDAATLA